MPTSFDPVSRLAALLVLVLSACAPPFSGRLSDVMPDTPDPRSTVPIDGFVPRIHHSGPLDLPYRLFVPPDYDPARSYPMIVWLHGAGGIGNDNVANISGDQIRGTRTWTTPESQRAHPAFVLVPQTNSGWRFYDGAPMRTQPLGLVLEIVATLKREFAIDPARIYVSGQSLGGGGSWDAITVASHPFAAAIILCPVPIDPPRAARAANTPIWFFVGSTDTPITVEQTRRTVVELRAVGANPRFTEYTDLGHDIWDRVYEERDLPRWLFAQKK